LTTCSNCGKSLPTNGTICAYCGDEQESESPYGKARRNLIIRSLLLGLLSSALMYVPILSIPFVFVAFPFLLIPPFNETGVHVEYIFLSVALKSGLAWGLFTIYFGVIWYFMLRQTSKKNANRK